MKQIESLQIHNLGSSIAYCEAMGLSLCFEAYSEDCCGEYILGIGFNPNSGYVYIDLENGVSIRSMLGRDIEYLVVNSDKGEETFYESYFDAINSIAI